MAEKDNVKKDAENAPPADKRTDAQERDTQNKSEQADNSRQNDYLYESNRIHVPARSTGLCALASLLLVLASLFLIHFEMKRIGSVRIAEGSYVTETAIAEIVGAPEGKYLPALDRAKMEKEIKALSPMIADVRFELSLTRRLTVRITDEKPHYSYRCEDGRVLLLNADFKALSYHHPTESCKKTNCEYEKGKLTDLYVQQNGEIVLGELLPFTQNEELLDFIHALIRKRGSLYEKLNLLDVRSARHVVFIFDDLVCAELSETQDFEIKCLALEKMMAKRKTREEEIETRFTYVDPVSGSIYWALEEWANLYEDYPHHR